MKDESTIAVIVTFNPKSDQLIKNISNVIIDNGFVLCVDNGSNNSTFDNPFFKNNPNLYLIRLANNKGLAYAQNVGIEYAKGHDFDYVTFLDQDSDLPPHFTQKMIKEYDVAAFKYHNIGMLVPNFFDKNIKEFTHFAKLTKHSYVTKKFKGEHFLMVSFAVASGSLMRVDLFNKVGMFIDKFFIDQIDTEFCLRLLSHDFTIIATSKVVLKHTIGNRKKKKLFFLTIKPNYHSEFRKYTIFRNGVKTVRIYGNKFKGFRILMNRRFVHDFIGVVFFEKHKAVKIKAMLEGILDGRKPIEQFKNKF